MAARRISHPAPRGLRPQAAVSGISIPVAAVEGKDKLDPDEVRRLKEAGECIADAVRAIAGRFSRRIPLSVKVDGDENGIYVQAGGDIAPNAYPFDPETAPPVYHPNRARRGSYRYRHSKWFAQPYRPFLEQGGEAGADEAANKFAEVINDWANARGFNDK